MADDIVTRLRQQKHRCIDCEGRGYFECMNVYPKCESCGGSGVCRKCGDQDAADEIERLRAEVARLGSFLHPVGMLINTKHGAVIPKAGIEGVTDEEVNEYLKVVRGE